MQAPGPGAFAEVQALPVGAAFRRQDLLDNGHPNYAGDVGIGINPKLQAGIRAADLLLVVGARLGEITTGGYTRWRCPAGEKLVHVHPGAEELAASTSRSWPSRPARAPSSRPPAGSMPRRFRTGRGGGGRPREYLDWNAPVGTRALQMAESWPGCATTCRRMRS